MCGCGCKKETKCCPSGKRSRFLGNSSSFNREFEFSRRFSPAKCCPSSNTRLPRRFVDENRFERTLLNNMRLVNLLSINGSNPRTRAVIAGMLLRR